MAADQETFGVPHHTNVAVRGATLTARVLKELENGPGTYAEIAAALPDVSPKSVCGTLCNLETQGRVVIVSKVANRNSRGGRRENVYALPGVSDQGEPKTASAPSCEEIAGGEYAIATSRTYPQYVYPGKGSRRGL